MVFPMTPEHGRGDPVDSPLVRQSGIGTGRGLSVRHTCTDNPVTTHTCAWGKVVQSSTLRRSKKVSRTHARLRTLGPWEPPYVQR